MRAFLSASLLSAGLLAASAVTVESTSLTGAENSRLSRQALIGMQSRTGTGLRETALEGLVPDARNETEPCSVSPDVAPGASPEQVRVILLVCDGGGSQAPPAEEPRPPGEVNVNSRYTVEDIDIRGAGNRKLSDDLYSEIQRYIGRKFSPDAMEDLARRIRKELRAHSVVTKVVRGAQAERVKVVFDVVLRREQESELNLSKFVYHSRQAWSAKLFGNIELGPNAALIVGVASDADDLLERYAGVGAGFEARKVGTDRVRLRFLFENYHHQWNRATVEAFDLERHRFFSPNVPGIYRTRRSFQPGLTVVLTDSLRLTAGAACHQLEMQHPFARDEWANAAVGGLHYRRSFPGVAGDRQEFRASYEIHAGTGSLDSDFRYTRHAFAAGYKIGGPRQTVVAQFTAGRLAGAAPLFERYTLGDSRTLRGWSKFDLAPAGGDRMVHNTLEYRRRAGSDVRLAAFYDAGAVWSRGAAAQAKHAVGLGLRTWRFQTSVAFPVRSGRMEPMFMAGVYFTEDADF